MPLTSPFTTGGFIAYVGDVITTNLTFAVWLIDDFTQGKPVGSVTIFIKENGVKAMQNLSGYYPFTDLAAGHYTVHVESEYYSPIEKSVDTSVLDAKNPVVEILVKPNARYPFPGSATLVRGVVTNAKPIDGADVSVAGKMMTAVTDKAGEFVLFFRGIKTEAVTIVIKKAADTKSVGATIEEGKTVSTGILHFP